MADIFPFQKLTSEMKDACGFKTEEYSFFYTYEKEPHFLDMVKKKKSITLSDKFDIWKINKDGLSFSKMVSIAYPNMLMGPSGVACEGAELGLCIIWTCKPLNQTGCILPESDSSFASGRTVKFAHDFFAGSINGSLLLELVLYIKKSAKEASFNEENLSNDTGVIVGELESVFLEFKNIFMEFPMKVVDMANEPLWWLSIKDWDNPREIEMFSKDSFCLYLNSHYSKSCPVLAKKSDRGEDIINGILNFDMLIDILAQTYFLLFKTLEEKGELEATKNNIGLVDGTVCNVLYQFIESCEGLNWDRPELLLKSLQSNLRRTMQQEEP